MGTPEGIWASGDGGTHHSLHAHPWTPLETLRPSSVQGDEATLAPNMDGAQTGPLLDFSSFSGTGFSTSTKQISLGSPVDIPGDQRGCCPLCTQRDGQEEGEGRDPLPISSASPWWWSLPCRQPWKREKHLKNRLFPHLWIIPPILHFFLEKPEIKF